MRSKIVRVLFGGALFCVLVLGAGSVLAQATGAAATGAPTSEVGSGITGWVLSLASQYPWLATVLLIIGGLRCVFKPIMSLIDGYVKANCSAQEYARLQAFESGPIYRWLNFGLDFVGSVKLPVVGIKPTEKSQS